MLDAAPPTGGATDVPSPDADTGVAGGVLDAAPPTGTNPNKRNKPSCSS